MASKKKSGRSSSGGRRAPKQADPGKTDPPRVDPETVRRRGEVPPRAGGGPVVPRAGGGVIVPRAGGGVVVPRGVDPSGRRSVGLGWLPDLPDRRDWPYEAMRERAAERLERAAGKKLTVAKRSRLGFAHLGALPGHVDHRDSGWLPAVEDQGVIGSCTAQAVVGMMEFLMRRVHADHVDLSRLFLYKVTRKLLGFTGDTGAYIRSTIKASRVFGVPPESQWPYDEDRFEEDPGAYLYAYAANFKSTMFARLDDYNATGAETLERIKGAIADGNCAAFGFPVYRSIRTPRNWLGEVPYPRAHDALEGGHAVLGVGYDDELEVESRDDDQNPGVNRPGAILFRNSWGTGWGDDGYGYLPYAYVEDQLAVDWWTVYNTDWVNEALFEG